LELERGNTQQYLRGRTNDPIIHDAWKVFETDKNIIWLLPVGKDHLLDIIFMQMHLLSIVQHFKECNNSNKEVRSQKEQNNCHSNVTPTNLWQGNNMVLQQQQEPSCSLLHAKYDVWIKVALS
jgi:hypothetical protein